MENPSADQKSEFIREEPILVWRTPTIQILNIDATATGTHATLESFATPDGTS